MTTEQVPWGPFVLFALASGFTPGPNVIMLAGSGGAWGLKRTLPHLFGICFGFPVLLLAVQLGSAQVFRRLPWAFAVLTVASLAYVAWLALRIFRMGFGKELNVTASARPMSFIEAALFQWINGKAWQIALMVSTLFAAGSIEAKLGEVGLLIVITLVSGLFWIELGKRLARYLQHPTARRVYYAALAIALLLSTLPRGVAQLMSGAPP